MLLISARWPDLMIVYKQKKKKNLLNRPKSKIERKQKEW